jgi:ribosomal protein L37E
MSYYTRCGKKVYFTKCGKKFVKATNAETTGFTCKTNEYGELTEECGACGFPEIKKKGEYITYECRAGSQPPNYMNTLIGDLNNKNAIRVYSLNLDFCNSVFDYADKNPDLVPYWCRDSADCRKVISITCSKNKKGIAAKKRLAEKFFPCGE